MRRHALWIVGLTLAIEAVTVALRFGFGLESTRDTAALASISMGLRIHHGFMGLLMLLAARWQPARWRPWNVRFGAALVASDLIHHLLVLWPMTGSPQFDLTYPG